MKHVKGFQEAARLLQLLPRNVETRVLQAATMAGARVMSKQVKADAPRGHGKQSPSSEQYKRLHQNIKVAPLRSLRKKKGIRGARVSTGNAFWGRFLEFGTRFISAIPWFRPAIAKAQDSAIDKLKEGLGRGIEREATKLATKLGIK